MMYRNANSNQFIMGIRYTITMIPVLSNSIKIGVQYAPEIWNIDIINRMPYHNNFFDISIAF